MKKLRMITMCLLAMMATSLSVKAQEVTITLMPGWNWISVPLMDTLDFQTAMGTVTPVDGDIIKSHWGSAAYSNGQWRGTISQFYPGYGYHYKSNRTMPVFLTFTAQQPDPQGDDHEYVDLGLPSGLLWATCNVGANAPEDYGDYFAWGETQPKVIYNWDTYQFYDGFSLTKYTLSDGLTTLLPEDDAATVNWGSSWRMPTKEEWQELYQNTTLSWITQNGVDGRLFTATNGNSLFLPAAGEHYGSSFGGAGGYGLYWSSSLYTDYPGYAWYFQFSSSYYNMNGYNNHRDNGQSVRAVREN